MNLDRRYAQYVDKFHLYGHNGYAGLNFRCRQLFRHAGDFTGKHILEIGGGEGLFSLWAVANGAGRAVVLEPEAAGSTDGTPDKMLRHRAALGFSEQRLILIPSLLQDYQGADSAFDIVLSYSSINHLDEAACINIQHSREARDSYVQIFSKIRTWLRPRGFFIISDAGRVNYWNAMGLQSPIASSIEWHKHQEPEIWLGLLKEVGFEFVALEWHQFYPLRVLGKVSANRLFARLTSSQFVLTVRKVP